VTFLILLAAVVLLPLLLLAGAVLLLALFVAACVLALVAVARLLFVLVFEIDFTHNTTERHHR
jgi:hypothetical protein